MSRQRRSGFSLVYAFLLVLALTAVASLAVDLGRVQIVKTQLRQAADAAARAAAADMGKGSGAARDTAVKFAKANLADGTPVILDKQADIEFLHCDIDPLTKKPVFTSTTDPAKQNAVHVTTHRVSARKTAVPLMMANLVGFGSCDVSADTIVMMIPGVAVNQNVPATANPFLAGMPKGSVASVHNEHNSPDYAGDATNPRQSPLAVNMPIAAGGQYTFDTVSGDARHDPTMAYYGPDGQLSDINHNSAGSENGVGDIRAPINSLVGVFLGDDQPSKTKAPPATDVTDDQARNKVTVSPELKQIFYIGDGLTLDGKKQTFVAPTGATRLYLATWDFFEWNNNAGFRNIQVNRPQRIITVK